MIIIAGLGNPGSRYENNRHNIGFMAIDAIHDRHDFLPWSRKFKADVSHGMLAGEKVLLIKPLSFMNLSGEAVGAAMRFYKSVPEDMIAIHDELDLPPGKARIKTGGGHGGHNGIKSLDAHCGFNYRRLRLGIGHPGDKSRVHGHVLGDFAESDRKWLEPLLSTLADNADMLARGEDSLLMNELAAAIGGKTGHEKQKATKMTKPVIHHVHNAPPIEKKPKTGSMAKTLKNLLASDRD